MEEAFFHSTTMSVDMEHARKNQHHQAYNEQRKVVHPTYNCVVCGDIKVYLEDEQANEDYIYPFCWKVDRTFACIFLWLAFALASAFLASFIIIYVKPNESGTNKTITT